jgi:hypothetical protein
MYVTLLAAGGVPEVSRLSSKQRLCCEQQIFETMAGTVSARCRSAEVPIDVQSLMKLYCVPYVAEQSSAVQDV